MNETEIKNLMTAYLERNPAICVEDMVKLLYQNEFAGGHLIDDKKKSLERLKNECEAQPELAPKQEQAFEDIGNDLCRMNIRALGNLGITLATANSFFTETAASHKGSIGRFEKKLDVFLKCCWSGLLPFEPEKAEVYIRGLKAQGYPPVSHSAAYRGAYSPAYRVVKIVYRDYLEVFRRIDALLKEKGMVTVAIDGCCGAGKSMLASLICGVYDCNVFHMDDFFLRPVQRTPQRLKETGGNVDYERFAEEIIAGLRCGKGFSYRKYDCGLQALDEEIDVKPKKLNIIEGSYSMHPKLIEAYDLKILLQTDERKQKERILKRSGEAMLKRFINEWIPLEDEYMKMFGIKEKSDIVYGKR